MAMQEFARVKWGDLQGSRCSNRTVRKFNWYLWCNQHLFQATNLRDCNYPYQRQGHNPQRWGK